jgi:hypothetical protein
MKLISKLESLENIISKHNSLIEKESRNLISEYSISTSQETLKELEKIGNNDRLLQIGVVGRVKAGKSSLLNALLFDGKSILPKAATPMTAALTIISYGQELSAEVEFFTKDDIENIKYDASRYEAEYERLLKQKKAEKKAKRSAHKEAQPERPQPISEGKEKNLADRVQRELNKSEPSLSASHDQYQRIKKSGIDLASLESSKVVTFETLESLGHDLGEYVGAHGKYMPFTKSVHIRIPQENLKNIQIVDTPGVNDPVVSREERTRALLKFCDVVFIVSPAGQFMSSEDLELMDRITSKEGVRELFVIASKCDMQLYGSVKDSSAGDLHKAFDSITTDLASSLHSTLSNLKKTNPEIGNAYDKLIAQSKASIIHSSGISLTIKEAYDNLAVLDSGEAHAWKLLVDNYPDYFSMTDKKLTIPNLDLLSNMSVISKAISDVRTKKDEILAKRKEAFLKAKTDSLEKYKKELLRFIELRIGEIKDGDVDELKAVRKRLTHIKLTVSSLVDEEYYDLVDELKINMNSKLSGELKSFFKATKGDIDNAEGSKAETWEVSISKWYNPFSYGSTETRSQTVSTVRTGAVRSAISDLTMEIEGSIECVSDKTILAWRKSLTPVLLSVLRDNVDDEDLKPSQVRKVVRNVINCVEFPNLSYQDDLTDEETKAGKSQAEPTHMWNFPFHSSGNSNSNLRSATGTLSGSGAEHFLGEAKDYISSLKKRVSSDIDTYLDDLIAKLKSLELSNEIFSEYDSQLEELEKQIENSQVILDEYNLLNTAITGLI